MIDIKSYAKPKTSTTGVSGGSGGNIINNNPIDIQNTDSTLNISRNDDTFIIDSNTFKLVNNKLVYTGTVDINNLIATSVNATSVTSGSGNISNLISNTGNITNLTSDDATIETLSGTTLNYTDGTFETLEVTKAAHFWQLIIDEVKSTQGQIIITAANAKLDLVEQSQNGFKCYWKNTDGDKTIYNQFELNDLVLCQTFNLDDATGTHQTNKFYWSKVIGVGTETKGGNLVPLSPDDPRYDPNGDDFDNMVVEDAETYNYIILSTNDYDTRSNAVPEPGDEIVQLGNKTNTDRQAAIIISAYRNTYLDTAIIAPSIVQYDGINSYSLSNHRLNVISKGLNQFKGNFQTTAGDIQTQINNNKKTYFPILKPWYDYEYNLITDYANDPLRYKGDADIYSTPTYLEPGTYKIRVFINSSSLNSLYAICYHGNQYPDDLGGYDPIEGFSISMTGRQILAKDGSTLYEYTGEVTISENGYYGLNWWENYYIYVPEESNEFEKNYSRITQTNNRITTEVGNINGQISTINQRADSIELSVNDTNVRLDNGQFTINADTNVNGNLSITSANEGFVLNNTYGNTYIVGDSIGTFDNFKQKNYIIKAFSANVNADATTPSTQTYEFNYNFPIGQLGLNTKIEFNDISFVTHKVSDGSLKSEDSYDAYVSLYKEGEEVCVWNINNTYTPTNYYTTNATTPYSYSISIRLICGYSHYSTLLETLNCAVTLKLKEYTQTFNIIGYDGMASNFGANKTFYVGNEGTYVKYGDDKILKVSTNGIQKYAGSTASKLQNKGYSTDTCYSQFISEYSPISGVTVRKVTSLNANPASCYLQPNDEMLVFKLGNSAQGLRCNVYLGLPASNTGRKVYLKQMGNYGNIYVYGDNYNGQTNKIRTADGYTTSEREIDNRSRYFISDGEYWIEYYCG